LRATAISRYASGPRLEFLLSICSPIAQEPERPLPGLVRDDPTMSHSRFLYDRFRQRERLRKSVALAYVVAMLVYLAWRVTVINPHAIGLSLTYFTAEAFGFVLGLTLIFSSWNYRHREPSQAPAGLSVDVFVTTYKEPVDFVRWTLIGAKEITYPHRTFLLDDGNRPEMKALAEEIGARYLARGKNIDAKAGNLNFGLVHSDADFVMVFDADHIASPHALDLTLGFFRDPRVAMVQTPQDYYNVDSFQYFNARRTGGLWHDQSFFYLIAQSCRDYFNGASCVGTSVVYRRSALDAIGGIPVETVTEDIHTSLKMHKAGYEVVYLNEPIAYGVAAADIRDYYRTRHRWAHGNLHALRIENVLFCSELTIGQKLSYLTLGLIYLEGWQQLMLFIVPMVSLFLGWAPFQITFFNVLVILLFPLLTTALLQELGCGLSRIWANEVFSIARFPVHLAASAALFVGKMPFRTSVKNVRGRIEWGLMAPQIVVLMASLVSVAAGVLLLSADFKVGPLAYALVDLFTGNWGRINWGQNLPEGYTVELVAVAGGWALFNAAKAGYLIHKAIADARRSAEDYRFEVRLPLEIDTPSGPVLATVERLSRSWFAARVGSAAFGSPGDRIVGRLCLPSGPMRLEGSVQRRSLPNVRRYQLGPVTIELTNGGSSDDEQIECSLLWKDADDLERLTRSLYSVNWHREFMHRDAFFLTPTDFIGRILALKAPFRREPTQWCPVLYRTGDTKQRALGIVGRRPGRTEASFLAFKALDQGTSLTAEIPGSIGVETCELKVLSPEPIHSLAVRGLDGATVRRFSVAVLPKRDAPEIPSLLAAAAE
jgi:cellulose synthase (UDP-forming)